MRSHSNSAILAAELKLKTAMKNLDAHVKLFDGAITTPQAQVLLLKLGLMATCVVSGHCTRSDVSEFSKSVAASLGIPHYVTEAHVDFYIAFTELSAVTGKSTKRT